MTRARDDRRGEPSSGGARLFFVLAGATAVAAAVLAAGQLPQRGHAAWSAHAIDAAAPGSIRFEAERKARWTVVGPVSAAAALREVEVHVRDLDTGDVVVSGPSAVLVPAATDAVALGATWDVWVPSAGRYEIVLHGPAASGLLLVEDLPGRVELARRAELRAGGVLALGVAASLALMLLGLAVRRERPRKRATLPRSARAAPRPRFVTTRPRGLQVTPAVAGRPSPNAGARATAGLYRPLPVQRQRSVFEEETEALDAISPFTSDIWEVPTLA